MSSNVNAVVDGVVSAANGVSSLDPSSIPLPVVGLALARERRSQLLQYIREEFSEGEDFSKVAGESKNSLRKPGAEKLIVFLGLEPILTAEIEDYDWTGRDHGEPFFFTKYRCLLKKNGVIAGVGEGSCNSWETKYRWRWVPETAIPKHLDKGDLASKSGTISEPAFAVTAMRTSGPYGKPMSYWEKFIFAIQGGTARKAARKDRKGELMEIWEVDEVMFRIPNQDPANEVNTVQKIAQKRSIVAATLMAAAISDLFTQDLDDDHEPKAEQAPSTTSEPQQKATEKEPAPSQEKKEPAPQTTASAADEVTRKRTMRSSLFDLSDKLGEQVFTRLLGSLGVTSVDHLSLEKGAEAWKMLKEFSVAMDRCYAMRESIPPDVWGRTCYMEGVTGPSESNTLADLKTLEAALVAAQKAAIV